MLWSMTVVFRFWFFLYKLYIRIILDLFVKKKKGNKDSTEKFPQFPVMSMTYNTTVH